MTLDQLLPAYRDSLVRFAESYAHRSSEAEDVVQDVFVRIIRAETARTEGGLRHYDRPGAYLRRAVANESVSHWRRANRERPTAELPERAGADHADRVTDRIVVRDAVAALPERMRQVITLSFLEGMGDADVATALGIAEITVRTTRKRALGHLRLTLADLGAERTVATVPAQVPTAVTVAATTLVAAEPAALAPVAEPLAALAA
jgi:RNA polymerase sigma factor (sigma-70 family)